MAFLVVFKGLTPLQKIQIGLILIIPFCVLLFDLKAVANNCFNGFDLGIYHQDIIELWRNGDWNPYSTVRGVKVFNDHFNPAMYLGALFIQMMGGSVYVSIVFEYLCSLIPVLLVFFLPSERLNAEKIWFSLFMVLSSSFLSALTYSVHIDFWSIGVWVLFVWAWLAKRTAWTVGAAFLICLFKESYPLTLMPFSLYLFFVERSRKAGLFSFLISLLFAIMAFYLRPQIMGPIHGHGMGLIKPLITSPISYLAERFSGFDYRDFLSIYWPLLLLFIWRRPKQFVGGVVLIAPLFVIQFLFNSFGHQYGFPIMIVPLSVYFWKGKLAELQVLPRWSYGLLLGAFLSSYPHFEKIFETLVFNKNSHCQISQAKSEAFHTASTLFYDLMIQAPEAKVAATGGIIPQILKPGLQLYHIRSMGEIQDFYSVLFLERNQSGDSFPLTSMQVDGLIERCSPYVSRVLQQDNYFYLALGQFPKSCVY